MSDRLAAMIERYEEGATDLDRDSAAAILGVLYIAQQLRLLNERLVPLGDNIAAEIKEAGELVANEVDRLDV